MRNVIIVGIFGLLAFLQYYPSLGVYFLSDDFIWLYQAEHAESLSLLTNYIDADAFFYRPTTKAYFFFAYRFFGLYPLPYHLIQVLLHGMVGASNFLLAQHIFIRTRFADKRVILSAISAVLFVVHPVHTEVVVWISAITELIPALCIFLSLLLVTMQKNTAAKRLSRWSLVGILVLYTIAVGAHEYAIVLPGMLFIWQLYLMRDAQLMTAVNAVWQKGKRLYLCLGIIGLGYLLLRYIARSHWQGGDYSYSLVNLPFNLIGNSLSYVVLSLIGPGFYEVYAQVRVFFKTQLAVAVIAAVAGGVILRYLRKYVVQRSVLFLVGLFVLGIAAFLPLGTIAERYSYFSAWLVYVAAVWLVYTGVHRVFSHSAHREFLGVAFFFVGLFSVLTFRSFRDWHIASAEVVAITGYFESQCDAYAKNDVIALDSPVNRVGRAWVFQVGVEEAASLVCGKNLKIIRR